MARLLADENFPLPVIQSLIALGHMVLTLAEIGKANQAISDKDVLKLAISENRAVLTMNRRHFLRLGAEFPNHAGILVCTFDRDFHAQAQRIHRMIEAESPLAGKLLRVNRLPR
jgi:hypothetical protein